MNEISGITSAKAAEFQRWSDTRLNRVVVDYLLREGLTETAKQVAQANHVEVSILFLTHTHTHTHIYIYIYMCVCVCVCIILINVLFGSKTEGKTITNYCCID